MAAKKSDIVSVGIVVKVYPVALEALRKEMEITRKPSIGRIRAYLNEVITDELARLIEKHDEPEPEEDEE